MNSLTRYVLITMMAVCLITVLPYNQAVAQALYPFNLSGTPGLSYGYPWGTASFGSGFLAGGGFYNSPFSPFNLYNSNYYLRQCIQMYNYLDYCLNFYEIARQTPYFYLYDQTADYIGANLYNYARTKGISPQVAIISFIQENLFQN